MWMGDTMKRSALTSFLALISAISAAVWFGLSLASQSLAYDLFVTGTTVLRNLPVDMQLNTIRLVANTLTTAAIAYAVMVLSVKMFLWVQRANFKKYGYLMMCMLLYSVSVPFGLYFAWLSLKLYWTVGDHYSIAGMHADTALPAFVELFTTRSWMNFLSLGSFVTIIALLIFKPLRQVEQNH